MVLNNILMLVQLMLLYTKIYQIERAFFLLEVPFPTFETIRFFLVQLEYPNAHNENLMVLNARKRNL